MEENLYLCSLYDCYHKLLTEKQCLYFEDYYFNNLSYGEISKEYKVSRNAIYHQLQLIEKRLGFFEEKLNLYSKKQKINDIIDLIDDRKAKRIIRDLF
jgi:predicted DNA-binding protein YlxM (UPF0122 family)